VSQDKAETTEQTNAKQINSPTNDDSVPETQAASDFDELSDNQYEIERENIDTAYMYPINEFNENIELHHHSEQTQEIINDPSSLYEDFNNLRSRI
jgi:hypothetical protein